MSKRKYGDSEMPTRKKQMVKRYSSNRPATFYGKPSKIEKKAFDVAVGTVQVNTTGSFTLLAIPVLGSDFNARIGRKICMKSCYIRGLIGTENALDGDIPDGVTQASMARMILFADMQPNGATPATTDLLVSASPMSQLNLNNRDRFRILSDKQWVFDPYALQDTATQSFASASRQVYAIKKYKKMNIETVFNATNGGTIADINSGALFLFFISNIASGANDHNAIISTRVRYTDM